MECNGGCNLIQEWIVERINVGVVKVNRVSLIKKIIISKTRKFFSKAKEMATTGPFLCL